MKTQKIILRIIALPFVLVIMLVNMIKLFVVWIYNWIRYGGEMIVYNEKFNQTTITDVYKIVQEQQHQKQLFQALDELLDTLEYQLPDSIKENEIITEAVIKGVEAVNKVKGIKI